MRSLPARKPAYAAGFAPAVALRCAASFVRRLLMELDELISAEDGIVMTESQR
jgi:hypothetical protein